MAQARMTADEKRLLGARLRTPAISLAVLLLLLGVTVLCGAWLPFRQVWIVEFAATVVMVLTVLVVSMELLQEPPIIRFFAVVGFFWVAILFTMTLLDYLTR